VEDRLLALRDEDGGGLAGMSATGRGRAREPEDYYTTPSWCVRRLFEAWRPRRDGVWLEPSAGNGAIIRAIDDIDLGEHESGSRPWKWLACEIRDEERETLADLVGPGNVTIGSFVFDGACGFHAEDRDVTLVIGNPPYSLAWPFVAQARQRFPCATICYLLRVAFAASEERNAAMRYRAPDVYLLPNRPSFTGDGSDSADYAWFVWPAVVERSAGRFQVLNTTPLAERQRDRGHAVMIEDPQRELFG